MSEAARSGDLMASHAHIVSGRADAAAALIDRHADALDGLPLVPPFELVIFPANVLILLERFAAAERHLDRLILEYHPAPSGRGLRAVWKRRRRRRP